MGYTFDEAQFLEYVEEIMTGIDTNIYNGSAPSSAIFPYGVMEIKQPFQNEGSKTKLMIYINFWDYEGNRLRDLLALVKKFKLALHKLCCENENMNLNFNHESTFEIPTGDSKSKRRESKYIVEYYNKNIT